MSCVLPGLSSSPRSLLCDCPVASRARSWLCGRWTWRSPSSNRASTRASNKTRQVPCRRQSVRRTCKSWGRRCRASRRCTRSTRATTTSTLRASPSSTFAACRYARAMHGWVPLYLSLPVRVDGCSTEPRVPGGAALGSHHQVEADARSPRGTWPMQ